MWGSYRAELGKLVRRPAIWLMLVVSLVLSLIFTYVIPYAGYSGTDSGAPGARNGLAAMLPDQLVGNSIAGLPIFAGAIALVVGVLAVGGEYGWGTWKTVLTQGPSRLKVYAGKLAVVCLATLVMVLSFFGAGAATSLAIASAENQAIAWPSVSDLAVGFGAGWLIATMWAALGMLLAIWLRGVALPIGLGLVWMLAVQNLLASIAAPLLDWVATLQKGLPGPNAGALVAGLGGDEGTPGVAEIVGTGQATLVMVGYVVLFAGLGAFLLRRRDVL